ncbi:uncharacterized protein LOC107861892 isoform X2 [Capsicum annuum]|uniref:uncharacterized protein LOC107861892 isoform X2 n=1 Tax=Capsicum annuum TaxID=4072 RepID=UPI001FB05504|nr:uncharacterized protein LOC107861892 isoform X2 [Capsicum annuum]
MTVGLSSFVSSKSPNSLSLCSVQLCYHSSLFCYKKMAGAGDLVFTPEEMVIDQGLGYPKAYAKLCKDRILGPFNRGPPFTFTPYALPQDEVLRAKELDDMFPIVDLNAQPNTKPKIFASLLWKQLSHLGNAGFDPEVFRVDSYGNVLYYHADSASPLAWEIDHWFPCSRGGLTVPSNLRIMQWQACKKKNNKLEFLIPWWDLQVGISINQFLSIFAISNSDFRRRAFSWLFSDGESEELNASQTVDSHVFPHHFVESKEKIGLAPAAVVLSRRESFDSSSALKSLDINRRPRSSTPIVACKRSKTDLKENEDPGLVTNPYQAIVIARDSLRHREETAKMQAEIQKLDDEVGELKQKTEEEKVAVQDLELILMKKRRRAEKCRRLAESQSSYKAMLEKMIRDAMHQSVVYKEQVRLNQAAANALMARLEAQRAICDSAERDLHRRFKKRDELEQQIRHDWDQTRKRSRMDEFLDEEGDEKTLLRLPGSCSKAELEKDDKRVLCLPGMNTKDCMHKELRVFLEEEQKAYEARLSLNGGKEKETHNTISMGIHSEHNNNAIVQAKDEDPTYQNVQNIEIQEEVITCNPRFPTFHENVREEEDEESRQQRGKGNVEKWLQLLLDNSQEPTNFGIQTAEENNSGKRTLNAGEDETIEIDDTITKLNITYPQKEMKTSKSEESEIAEDVKQSQKVQNKKENVQEEDSKREEVVEVAAYRLIPERRASDVGSASKGVGRASDVGSASKGVGRSSSCERTGRKSEKEKERELSRSDSVRLFRRIPSSPSLLLSGMKKRVDCMRTKPSVVGDDSDEGRAGGNGFIKSSIKTIKRAVKM